MIRWTLGLQLRRARRDRHLSLRELARLVGVSHVQLSRVEHDRATPTSATLRELALVLGLGSDHLHMLAGVVPDDLRIPLLKQLPAVRALLESSPR